MSTSSDTGTVPAEDASFISTVPDGNEKQYRRIQGALRRINRAVEIDSKRLSNVHNITGPQLVVLRCIVKEGPMMTTEISKDVHLSPSTVVGILDRLQARKLIQRRRSDHDRRQVIVKATEAGKRLAGELSDPGLFGLSTAIENLPQYELESLTRTLENIVDQLDNNDVYSRN